MKTYYQWTVKKLTLKKKIVKEFEHEAIKEIGNAILNGEFNIILEKKEREVAEVI